MQKSNICSVNLLLFFSALLLSPYRHRTQSKQTGEAPGLQLKLFIMGRPYNLNWVNDPAPFYSFDLYTLAPVCQKYILNFPGSLCSGTSSPT